MSNYKSGKTIYERRNCLKQARKEIKYGISLNLFIYVGCMIIAMFIDYQSNHALQDLILRTNEKVAIYMNCGIIVLSNVLASLALTKLIKAHFNQKKLNKILIFSVLFSIGMPMILLVIQKVAATEVMIPDRGTTITITITKPVKFITQFLFAFIPVGTSVSLTVMSLLRENIKVFSKYRYLQLVRADIKAERDHIDEALNSDIATLKEKDDSNFISTIMEILAMQDSLFEKARDMLAMHIGDPAATEQIVNSEPVYRASDQYRYITKHLMLNPAIKVAFEDIKKEESAASLISNISIIEKKEKDHEETA